MLKSRIVRGVCTLSTCVMLVAATGITSVASANNLDGDAYQQLFSDSTTPAEFKFLRVRLLRYLRSLRGNVNTLDDAADGSGRLVGAAINRGAFENDATYLAEFNEEFSYFTPENYAKWGLLQPTSPDEWDFSTLDAMVQNAEDNDQLFKGHAFIWHIELPSFINEELTPEELRALYERHIQMTGSRYAGRIYAWDVVNEAIEEDGSYRDTIWLRKFGPDYIADAFYAAKAADPSAQLLYNDYAIDRINPKSNGVYNMVKGLVEAGVPIDGVGFQMHLSAETAPSVEQIVENMERFTALGLTVNVSELDVRISNMPWDFVTRSAIQQQVYHRVVDACLRVAGCEAITTWGLTDRYTWIDGTFGADDPLQLDEDYNRKPAYYGMVDGFVGIDADPISAYPNLVANGNIEVGTNGWSADGGTIKSAKTRGFRGYSAITGKHMLQSENRTSEEDGPSYDLLGLLAANQSYDVSALGAISRRGRDNLAMTAELQCDGEAAQLVELADARARNRRWLSFDAVLTTPDCELTAAKLKFSGPKARARIHVDSVSVRPQVLVAQPRDDLGENLLTNGDFELGFDGWLPYAAGSAELSTEDTFNGAGAGRAFDRANGFDGISTELLGLVEPGKEYEFSGFAKIENADSERVQGTLFANCEAGPQYLFITAAQASNNRWSYLSGSITIPDCNASNLTFYFEGPQPGINFLVDDVSVREVIKDAPTAAIVNATFEDGTEGWYAFGPATVATSPIAYEGSQSLSVSNRTQTFEGPSVNITDNAVPGATYTLDAHLLLQNIAANEVRATVNVECSDVAGVQYLGVGVVDANDTDWTQITGSVTLPDCMITLAQLYFEGPAAGINILVDAVTLTGQNGGDAINLAANGDFEGATLDPWTATAGETLQIVTDPVFEGAQAVLASGRTQTYEGPGIDLVGLLTPGSTVNVNAHTRIAGSALADVRVTVRTVCEDSSESYLGAGSVPASDTDWAELSGSVVLPTCNASLQRFYFEGPGAGVDILVDGVTISAQ